MTKSVNADHVRIFRFVLLGGILSFGMIAAFVASGNPGGIATNVEGPLVPVVAILVLAAAGVVMFIRRKLEAILKVEKRARLLFLGHMACEAAAMVGAVHLLLTGAVMPFVAGLAVFVFSLVLLPVEHA